VRSAGGATHAETLQGHAGRGTQQQQQQQQQQRTPRAGAGTRRSGVHYAMRQMHRQVSQLRWLDHVDFEQASHLAVAGTVAQNTAMFVQKGHGHVIELPAPLLAFVFIFMQAQHQGNSICSLQDPL
jgi:hypothetical protein